MKIIKLFFLSLVLSIISISFSAEKFSTYIEYSAESRASYGPCG